MSFTPTINLSDLDGSNGFVINGVDRDDRSGRAVSDAGDINGDGIDDLIISAPNADPSGRFEAGESYIVFGSGSGFGASLELAVLDGSNGFVINGIDSRDFSGGAISSAGDVNGDGIDDLIIGARAADPNGIDSAGESYVVFGSSSGFRASLELSELNGSNGFVINGIDSEDSSGDTVSSAGDINGDGIDDIVIGTSSANPNDIDNAGKSYVIFGSTAGFGTSLELSELDGSNGFVINGINSYDSSGVAVSSAGDVNGDGIDDLIIGAPGADPNGNNGAGASYVVFGSSSGFGASLELSALDGSNGFVINGITPLDSVGTSVSSAGDVNGDGIDDLIIGAPAADPNIDVIIPFPRPTPSIGESYVVFGSSSGFGASLELSALNGSNGFTVIGEGGNDLGLFVSGAEDVNGDGLDDLIIGARGESYVIFGSTEGFGASLKPSDLNGSNGFTISGYSTALSGAGDVNGDGFNDLIMGSSGADINGVDSAGQSYVVFGASPESIFASNLVFTFEQFVQYQAIDEGSTLPFSEDLYLLANPDVQVAVDQGGFTSGLEHFTQFGDAEGRATLPLDLEVGGLRLSALFDETYYLSQHGDIAIAVEQGVFSSGFEHFVLSGVAEGRSPSSYYDEAIYFANNTDVAAAVNNGTITSGLIHYLTTGHIENRTASALFNPQDYLLNNGDVQAAVEAGAFDSAFDHFIEAGAEEGRVSPLLFEEAFYLSQNPDVAAAVDAGSFASGFEHYVSIGQGEGRDPSIFFDESTYLEANPDVAEAVGNGAFSSGMEHFFRSGRAEGRPLG
ncbi:FG-GAP-like repeat-containing protein [Oscillatoria sp. CS-180]|uniref:FG-GAP-like repeat-containing protein n=1 Tax=Oscillatoria sp. CS-180 TaxID=3021720 RepID=UPI00232A8ECE|nr:FG-GAP-like repeat-containing protein [Oscillatoria sp. CS-180]MDB9527894.1 FG-GAP-like repeat-containing protein [Oscillatoria sp. CS-180]